MKKSMWWLCVFAVVLAATSQATIYVTYATDLASYGADGTVANWQGLYGLYNGPSYTLWTAAAKFTIPTIGPGETISAAYLAVQPYYVYGTLPFTMWSGYSTYDSWDSSSGLSTLQTVYSNLQPNTAYVNITQAVTADPSQLYLWPVMNVTGFFSEGSGQVVSFIISGPWEGGAASENWPRLIIETVPEPATLAILGLGALVAFGRKWA